MSLDVWERAVYYHLLRHTRVEGKDTVVCGISSLAQTVGLSESRVREAVRSLESKGAIKIETRSRHGHALRVLLPEEIGTLYFRDPVSPSPSPEDVDFYTGRKYVKALLAREHSRCFYCLRELSEVDCVLDHATPQVERGNNSYRNVVVSCHSCNSLKQGQTPEDYIRSLYRRGVLDNGELDARLATLGALQRGELVPELGGG